MNPQQQAQMRQLRSRIVTLEAALREVVFQCEDVDEGLEVETVNEIERVARNALIPPTDEGSEADG